MSKSHRLIKLGVTNRGVDEAFQTGTVEVDKPGSVGGTEDPGRTSSESSISKRSSMVGLDGWAAADA
jgi:hypothetical protein